MIVNILLGIVALGTMQATKPLNKKIESQEQSINVTITKEEWPMLLYFEKAIVYYEDKISETDKTIWSHNIDDYGTNNLTINFTGQEYILITEIDIYLNGGSRVNYVNIADGHEGDLKTGNYFLTRIEEDMAFTFTQLSLNKALSEDTEMYTIVTNFNSNVLEGWYAFEKKYTYHYGEQQKIYLANREVNKNALALYINDDNNYSYEDIYDEYKAYIDIDINNNVKFNYDDNDYETKNIFYFSNVTINLETIQNYYNLYRIEYPELLNSRIVNKTINFEKYNPLAFVNQTYGPGNIFTGWLTPTLNQQNFTRVRRWFNGIAKYNGETISDMLAWYSDGRAISYVDKDGTIRTNNAPMENCMVWMTSAGAGTEQKYTFVDGTVWWNPQYLKNFAWATYVNRFNSNGEIIGTADAGIPETYTNSIYIAVSNDFKDEVFANNFKNVSYTTFSEGNVFSLITQGFRSWLQIFQYKIGTISIGTLVLAPLVVGFLVWLIHLVKRG